MPAADTTTSLVELEAITKRFPGVQALDRVTLALRAGEIVGIAGENGSGKSTLVKILAGRYSADSGTVRVRGTAERWGSAAAALHAGIALVAQEVAVHGDLSVSENLLAGRMPRRVGFVRWGAAHRAAQALLDELAIHVDPARRLGSLPLNLQHMVAIAKAVGREPEVLILDEPTASLTEQQVQVLYDQVRRLRDRGTLVVYITHRLREYFELCDRIAVLRDGRLVGERSIGEVDEDQLVRLMVGRELSSVFERPDKPAAPSTGALLTLRGVSTPGKLRDVDLDVRAGEVVGVAGQAGSGRTTLARTLFGGLPYRGEISVAGQRVQLRSPRDAIGAGIVLVPEDRKAQGLVLSASVHDNLAMSSWHATSRFGIRDVRQEAVVANAAIERLDIRVPSAQTLAAALSGGNQQKVVIGKWLAAKPRVLVLDEPTRGVDVGAKDELYRLIDELAASGVGVLVLSSELLELLRLADRIVVLAGGRVAGELPGASATEESITHLAFAGQDDKAVLT